ncbi:hypothetical protein HPC49_06425 [Pyxidicoccus fallax]|uniref:Uncharacterized protein n=1 Tax=Pyxidicoccus fallax TaxID=394095 RepID=A0A848L7E9_9BACT|nr:hypothetical protein [Pyxidicoccus fallax]NMO14457.1 hypothetical protein [Pyxidicoccus fallax]NPC77889.1 hypothetical protein [Pyxidicoccus fallax]
MTPKLSRFLHLERSRGERTESETSTPLRDGGRFESLEERKEAHAEAAIPETHLERFKGEAPLALADAPEDTRRFPRCMVCESENGRFAPRCTVCGADLGTPEQLEFNERLWQERKHGLSRTRADEIEALRQQEEQRRREQAEQLELQIARLRAEERPARWVRMFSQHSTLGTALLSLIPHPLLRWLTLGGLFCLTGGLWRYGRGGTQLAGAMLTVFLVALFVPPGALRRGRR